MIAHQLAFQSESYWQGLLAGFSAPTPLVVDRKPEAPGGAFALVEGELAPDAAAELHAAAARHRVGAERVVQGAWALLLSRYAAESDVVFGAALSAGSLIPVRARIAGDAPAFAWIGALDAQLRESLAHAGEARDGIREWSAAHAGTPLFESAFAAVAPGRVAELAERLRAELPGLGVVVALGDRQLGLGYDPARFDADAAGRMLGHLTTLLREIATRPEAPTRTLALLTEAERRQLLFEWNDTARSYPETTLAELFRARALEAPDRTALVFEDRRQSYGELAERAESLAGQLRALGVGPDRLVGVYLERSPELVIALLGILEADGAYLPLDPEYPAERIRFMIADAGVAALLTSGSLAERLPPIDAPVLCLDTPREPSAGPAPARRAGPDDLAYVIYTSGSTGRPKGAANTHRAICNRLLWMQDEYGLTPEDTVLQKTPFSFDVSVWEFFWPLCVGARLVLARPGGHKDDAYLAALIREHEISVLHFVPSMLRLFLERPDPEACRSLRHVFCSGEALPFELQERFFALLGANLHNLYGPTEAAVDVTYFACERDGRSRAVPIGRPVANTAIYILDAQQQPVPIGVPGELHIGGVQLARGYHNRPELTAERFVPDPFGREPGARLYKTGDLARYRPDGNIEYLGRLDHQTKIRGFRIELGEIESVLLDHPDVKDAVVLAREDVPNHRQLVAYVASACPPARLAGALRSFLAQKLPDYMVPGAFVALDALPLTPNGKLDRRALPAPRRERPELERAYAPPRTPLERRLAGIWCELLQLDRVGVDDPFFELGGDSLLAAAFINRLRSDLGESIYIVSIFEAPSIAEYAAFLRRDYPDAVARAFGESIRAAEPSERRGRVDADALERMRQAIPSYVSAEPVPDAERNPPALFILGPPRSGTTLLRVMLAGHPDLFACSELQLLGFETLAERRAAFSGRFSLWLDGTIRALMELEGCDAEAATRLMEDYERRNLSTRAFYRELQARSGGRMLVDKSPFYALDPGTLRKAERDFLDPLYVHLVRHPYAMVRSFEDYHMDQVVPLRAHSFARRELAELVWTLSHRNILEFLESVPAERRVRFRFEELVSRPAEVLRGLCEGLSLPFHPELALPYKDAGKKMIDGVHGVSTPMGDRRFLEHGRIEPAVGEAWRRVETDDFLGDVTWELAAALGYAAPGEAASRRELRQERRQRRLQHRRRE